MAETRREAKVPLYGACSPLSSCEKEQNLKEFLVHLWICSRWLQYASEALLAPWTFCLLHLLSGSALLLFPGTVGKDKSWLSWLLTEEINHSAHRRIAFQSASWELHYPAPATHYHADRHWLGRRRGKRSLLMSPGRESQIILRGDGDDKGEVG